MALNETPSERPTMTRHASEPAMSPAATGKTATGKTAPEMHTSPNNSGAFVMPSDLSTISFASGVSSPGMPGPSGFQAEADGVPAEARGFRTRRGDGNADMFGFVPTVADDAGPADPPEASGEKLPSNREARASTQLAVPEEEERESTVQFYKGVAELLVNVRCSRSVLPAAARGFVGAKDRWKQRLVRVRVDSDSHDEKRSVLEVYSIDGVEKADPKIRRLKQVVALRSLESLRRGFVTENDALMFHRRQADSATATVEREFRYGQLLLGLNFLRRENRRLGINIKKGGKEVAAAVDAAADGDDGDDDEAATDTIDVCFPTTAERDDWCDWFSQFIIAHELADLRSGDDVRNDSADGGAAGAGGSDLLAGSPSPQRKRSASGGTGSAPTSRRGSVVAAGADTADGGAATFALPARPTLGVQSFIDDFLSRDPMDGGGGGGGKDEHHVLKVGAPPCKGAVQFLVDDDYQKYKLSSKGFGSVTVSPGVFSKKTRVDLSRATISMDGPWARTFFISLPAENDDAAFTPSPPAGGDGTESSASFGASTVAGRAPRYDFRAQSAEDREKWVEWLLFVQQRAPGGGDGGSGGGSPDERSHKDDMSASGSVAKHSPRGVALLAANVDGSSDMSGLSRRSSFNAPPAEQSPVPAKSPEHETFFFGGGPGFSAVGNYSRSWAPKGAADENGEFPEFLVANAVAGPVAPTPLVVLPRDTTVTSRRAVETALLEADVVAPAAPVADSAGAPTGTLCETWAYVQFADAGHEALPGSAFALSYVVVEARGGAFPRGRLMVLDAGNLDHMRLRVNLEHVTLLSGSSRTYGTAGVALTVAADRTRRVEVHLVPASSDDRTLLLAALRRNCPPAATADLVQREGLTGLGLLAGIDAILARPTATQEPLSPRARARGDSVARRAHFVGTPPEGSAADGDVLQHRRELVASHTEEQAARDATERLVASGRCALCGADDKFQPQQCSATRLWHAEYVDRCAHDSREDVLDRLVPRKVQLPAWPRNAAECVAHAAAVKRFVTNTKSACDRARAVRRELSRSADRDGFRRITPAARD
jgi:hypothetical protein